MSKSKDILNLLNSLRACSAHGGQGARTDWYPVRVSGRAQLEIRGEVWGHGAVVLRVQVRDARVRPGPQETMERLHQEFCDAGNHGAPHSDCLGQEPEPEGSGNAARPDQRAGAGASDKPARRVGTWHECREELPLERGTEVRALLTAGAPGDVVRLALSSLCITFE